MLPFALLVYNCFVSVEREQSNTVQELEGVLAKKDKIKSCDLSDINSNLEQISHKITVTNNQNFLLCEVVMNFWLFFLLRHFQGRNNLPMLIASLLRRTVGGVLGVELAPATGEETPTSVAFKNVGARLVGTVLPPFITMVFSLRPGSLFERSRERSRFPEGEILPSSATSIFYAVHRLILRY